MKKAIILDDREYKLLMKFLGEVVDERAANETMHDPSPEESLYSQTEIDNINDYVYGVASKGLGLSCETIPEYLLKLIMAQYKNPLQYITVCPVCDGVRELKDDRGNKYDCQFCKERKSTLVIDNGKDTV